jgi:hypothetical protein
MKTERNPGEAEELFRVRQMAHEMPLEELIQERRFADRKSEEWADKYPDRYSIEHIYWTERYNIFAREINKRLRR